MPRYFFNRIGRQNDPDPVGLDLPDMDHVRYEAVAFAADTLKDNSYALWDGGEVRIEVVDSTQILIFAIVISVVELTAGISAQNIVEGAPER